MTFDALANTEDRLALREAVRAVCDRFDDEYWSRLDTEHAFPHEFA